MATFCWSNFAFPSVYRGLLFTELQGSSSQYYNLVKVVSLLATQQCCPEFLPTVQRRCQDERSNTRGAAQLDGAIM